MKALPGAGWDERAHAPQDASLNLPRAMRDLAALATLPSIWVDSDVRHGIQNLTDVLRAALRAGTVCVRIELPDAPQFDVIASNGLLTRNDRGDEAAELLNAVGSSSANPVEIPRFNGTGPLMALPQPIFFEGRQVGYFVACFKQDVLPSPADRLLLHVAASQVMLLLQRHKDQEDLRRKNNQLAAFLDTAALGLHRVGPDGIILWANAAEMQMLGYTSEEYIGHHITEFHADRPVIDDILKVLACGEKLHDREARLRCKDGSIKHVVIDSSVLWQDGKFIHTQCFTRDVTDKKRNEVALRQTNERLTRVLEVETVGVMFWDLTTGCLVDANQTFLKMMGYSRADVDSRSLTWEKFTPPEYHEISHAEIAKFMATGRVGPYEKEYLDKNGKRRWLLFAGSSLGDNQCVEFCVDISERKQIEQALRESEDRFRTLADNISQLAWMTTKEGSIFWYNRQWFEYTGTTLEQMQGWGWEAVHHPEHLDRVKAHWKEHLQQGLSWEDTFPLRGADGNFRWFLSRAIPIRDERGNIVRWFGTNTDVTDLRNAQAQLSDRAVHLEELVAERTASLTEAIAQMEEFSYSVSHDLRAPARAIKGFIDVALEDYGATINPDVRALLEKVQASGQRMERLVAEILEYSRVARSDFKLVPISLDQLLPAVIRENPELNPPRASIHVQAPLGSVLAHEACLSQALTNILRNAAKFVRPGVTPEIQIWTERHSGAVRLWIKDNGIGINPRHHERLFRLFERAHDSPLYEGTGIGLAIVRKAAERMSGKVGLESDGVSGTSFWLELPAPSA